MPSPGARRSTASCCSGRGTSTPTACWRQIAGTGCRRLARERLARVLGWLDAAVDAAADAVNAESVYQLARGNLARAATLDDVAGGLAPPPRLELMRTPRTGTPSPTGSRRARRRRPVDPASGWAVASPRAAAEPRLDAWAAAMLGPAAGVDVVVAELDARGAEVTATACALTALGLSALDLVWISGDAGVATELAQRAFAASAGRTPGAVPAGAPRARPPPTAAPAMSATCSRWPAPCAAWSPAPGRSTAPTCSRRTPTPTAASTSTSSNRASTPPSGHSRRRDALGGRSTTRPRRSGPCAARSRPPPGSGSPPGSPRSPAATPTGAAGVGRLRVGERRLRRRHPRLADAERERRRRRRARGGATRPSGRRVRGVFGPGFVAVPVFRAGTAADLVAGHRRRRCWPTTRSRRTRG